MGVELNIAGLTIFNIFNQEKCPVPSTFVGEICRADPQFSEIQSIKGAQLRVFLHLAGNWKGGFLDHPGGGSQSWISGGGKDG